jgi:enamine deaminase RidA (YjgF/YER057c/UK114 family)
MDNIVSPGSACQTRKFGREGRLAKQIELTFLNIKAFIQDADGTMIQRCKISNHLIDLSQLQLFSDIRDKFINVRTTAASTTVQLSRLFRQELLVEIEATAIILRTK